MSAPIGPVHRVAATGRIWLAVNGATEQDSDIGQLLWTMPDIVGIVSRSLSLHPGGIDGLREIDVAVG